MKCCGLRWVTGVLLAAVLVSGSMALWRDQAVAAAQETGANEELTDAMNIIDRGFRKLRRSLRSAEKNADSLVTVVEIQKAAFKSKGEAPPRINTVPEAERDQFMLAYRKQMAEFISKLLEMEVALCDGDNEKAMALYDELKAMEDPSHEKFSNEGL